MIITDSTVAVAKLKKMWDSKEKTLKCDLPFQRQAGVWTAATKNNLIISLLSKGLIIQPLVFLKDKVGSDKGKDVYKYNILDGQQRLTSVFSFLNNEWPLHQETPEIVFEGFTYEVAGKTYGELESSLIISFLTNSFIPSVIFLKDKAGTDKGKDIYEYNILDGQQRLTTIFSFLNDEWPLHQETQEIVFDGFTYEIAGKKYSELEEELRNVIGQCKFMVYFLEDYTI